MGHSACAKMHFFVVGNFAFIFSLKLYSKCIKYEDIDSQGHSEYISIGRMS